MATVNGEYKVTLTADSKPLMRSLRGVQRQVWFWRYGSIVTWAVGLLTGTLLGIVVSR